MTNTNEYSRRYEMDIPNGIYGKILDSLPKISGEYPEHLFVRGSPEELVLIERNYNKMKEIVKIHSIDPEKTQSHLENITGVKFSKYIIKSELK